MFGGFCKNYEYTYNDLFINQDFKGGSSYLGFAYSADINQDERSTFLFGEEEPNIVEFEVYEII